MIVYKNHYICSLYLKPISGWRVEIHTEWRLLDALFLADENFPIFKELENNATVDAYGYIYVWRELDYKYIGVGFKVACFSSNGNGKAFVCETSRVKDNPRFFIRFQAILGQG